MRSGRNVVIENDGPSLAKVDPEVRAHLEAYAERLGLSLDNVLITTRRSEFERWVERQIGASIGGAYVYLPLKQRHAILINLARINHDNPRAVELVVAEELIHMRDHIDGDRRRHAKHGYDRIARRIADLTGATLEEIRTCTLPAKRRPAKYHYACPGCGTRVARRKRGTWSCGRCSPVFDRRFVLQFVGEIAQEAEGSEIARSI
jgi:predicted SprT family Zn-dependent metalloprotease